MHFSVNVFAAPAVFKSAIQKGKRRINAQLRRTWSMGTFTTDLAYGVRFLLKNPGFAAVTILTLALGVGANAAIFSVLRAVVLRDLPYRDPNRIAVMWTKNIRQNLPDGSSYLNFRDWKESSKQFVEMAAYIRPEFTRGTIGSASDAERLEAGVVGPG